MVASERWPATGLPPNPGGWITTTARNRAIDRLRREASRNDRHAQAALLHEQRRALRAGGRRERRPPPPHLHLLPPGARAERADRAHAATARRARDAVHRPRVPRARSRRWRSASCARSRRSATPRSRTACPATPSSRAGCARCSRSSTSCSTRATPRPRATSSIRADLCAEAIRLARLLAELMPDEPEALGLLALLLLTESRRAARTAPDGTIVLLPDQDRTRVGPRRSSPKARRSCARCLRRNTPGPYQIQAAINAVHSDAADRGRHRLAPDRRSSTTSSSRSRRARSSRSTARSRSPRSTGPDPALAIVDALDLDAYHLFHATRAELLARLDRDDEAARRVRPRARAREQRRRARAPRAEASVAAGGVTAAVPRARARRRATSCRGDSAGPARARVHRRRGCTTARLQRQATAADARRQVVADALEQPDALVETRLPRRARAGPSRPRSACVAREAWRAPRGSRRA